MFAPTTFWNVNAAQFPAFAVKIKIPGFNVFHLDLQYMPSELHGKGDSGVGFLENQILRKRMSSDAQTPDGMDELLRAISENRCRAVSAHGFTFPFGDLA